MIKKEEFPSQLMRGIITILNCEQSFIVEKFNQFQQNILMISYQEGMVPFLRGPLSLNVLKHI